MNKFISIITVVYNSADTIESTIRSVIIQRNKQVEYIVVDGGSTDGTIDILKKYESQIVWISEKDNGIYDAMNKGISIAKGDFLYFINCGDTLLQLPLAQLQESESAELVCFPIKVNDKETKKPSLNWKFKVANTLPHQGIFYSNNGSVVYNIKYKVFADYALNLDYYLNGKRIMLLNTPVVANHTTDGVSYSKSSSSEFFLLVKEKLGFLNMIFSYFYFKSRGLCYKIERLCS